jgi:hypothetical protein
LAVAAALILAERLGDAVRSPAKSALLAEAAEQVGMGPQSRRHKALDQIGAFAGPPLVAALVAYGAGRLALPLAALAVPGAASILLLIFLRARSRGVELPVPTGVSDLASAGRADSRHPRAGAESEETGSRRPAPPSNQDQAFVVGCRDRWTRQPPGVPSSWAGIRGVISAVPQR